MRVLLVEDDEVDAMTVRRALRTIAVSNPLVLVEQGGAALSYLNTPGNAPPCIILLDLNMPQRTWKTAANQFAILFGERLTNAIN